MIVFLVYLQNQWAGKQGRIQDFRIEGAQKMWNAHHERKALNPFNSVGVHKALEALWF